MLNKNKKRTLLLFSTFILIPLFGCSGSDERSEITSNSNSDSSSIYSSSSEQSSHSSIESLDSSISEEISSSSEQEEVDMVIRLDTIAFDVDFDKFYVSYNGEDFPFYFHGFSVAPNDNCLLLNNGYIDFDRIKGIKYCQINTKNDESYYFQYGFSHLMNFTSKTFSNDHTYYFNNEYPSHFYLRSENYLLIESIIISFDGADHDNPYVSIPKKEVDIEEHIYEEKSFVDFPTFPVTEGLRYRLSEDETYYIVDNADYADLGSEGRIVFPNEYNGLPVKEISYLGIWYRGSIIKEVYIPENIEKIENETFAEDDIVKLYWNAANCNDFPARNAIFHPSDKQNIDVVFGPKVKRIPGKLFLPSMMTPNVHPHIKSISFDRNCQVKEIGDYAFYGLDNLEKIDIPDSLNNIGSYTFYEVGINEMYLPNLKSIGDSAFRFCENLKHFYMPSSLEEIGESAFDSCINLVDVDLSNTKINKINKATFKDCTNLELIKFNEQIETFGESSFMGSGITILNLPISTISVDAKAFKDANKLTYIKLNQELKYLGEEAFNGCLNVTDLVINSHALEDLTNNNKTFLNLGKNTSLNLYIKDVTYLPKNMFYSSSLVSSLPVIDNLYLYNPIDIKENAFFGVDINHAEFYGFIDQLNNMNIESGNDSISIIKVREE